ncbi:MAG: toprim domain-containing protein [Hyphomonadaceae bacterium]|nr:toprim domain-containing protein [Hyphomonadaceae bacterium]
MSRLERIVAALGGTLLGNGRRALIPGPGHTSHDRSVSLTLAEDGRVLVHCFSPRDDWRAVRDHLRARGLLDDAPPDGRAPPIERPLVVQPRVEDKTARARAIWSEGVVVEGTPAHRYLHARRIAHGAASAALAFHSRASALDDRRRRPALLAAIEDNAGALQGVQITLLSAHGACKAPVATPRRVVGRLLGGAVRLHAHGATLLVAEGVETALAASQALTLPAWAALSAWNLAHFNPPGDIARLVIGADNGDAGAHAAHTLLETLAETRPEIAVEIASPPPAFGDWNDWACAGNS